MDRLDRLSAACLVVLVLWSLVLVWRQSASEQPAQPSGRPLVAAIGPSNPDLDRKIAMAKDLLAAENLAKAEELISGLLQEAPFEGAPHILMGDLHMRRQDPVQAMFAYRAGIDLNPDFLDKRTPVFQGKKIKAAVGEARKAILEGLNKDPSDQRLKEARTTLYYMQRRIAGSCG